MLLTLEFHPRLYELIIFQRDIEPMSSSSSPAGSGDTVQAVIWENDQNFGNGAAGSEIQGLGSQYDFSRPQKSFFALGVFTDLLVCV